MNAAEKKPPADGWTLRDQFAAHALPQANFHWVQTSEKQAVQEIARRAYAVADALMRERGKGQK